MKSESAPTAPVYNFSPGPAMLSAEVMHLAQTQFLGFGDSGLSLLETSHRSDTFTQIVERCEADLRALLAIPEDYAVLFLQGGATLQFLMAALNLARPGERVAYVDSGHWSGKAIETAREVRPVEVVASAEPNGYTAVPELGAWADPRGSAYLHYTANETVDGIEFSRPPDARGLALVADMSSNILSRPLEIERFGLIYAGAQKNLGPAGLALVVIRRELADRAGSEVPSVLSYRAQIEAGSLFNTPPTFTWWLIGLTLAWVREQGGVEEMARRAVERARIVYAAIDESGGFYSNGIEADSRSRMNVPFTLAEQSLEPRFLAQAEASGLKQLAGHRSKGGLRASLYNAMPVAGARALADFMRDFARRNG